MKLSEKFIEEISQFEMVYCLISGGYHSTTSALLLKDYHFENVKLLHNQTFLELDIAIETIKKVQEKTNFPFIELKSDILKDPNKKIKIGNTELYEDVWNLLKAYFQKVPKIKSELKKGKEFKKTFGCDRILKYKPTMEFFKTINKDKSVVISSLCPYEGNRRRWALHELRTANTFLRCQKSKGNIWYAYPFRDEFHEFKFLEYLRSKGFTKIRHTGCKVCPILVIYDHYDSYDYYNSLKAFELANGFSYQKSVLDFT